jgi:hypothetical protein
MESRSTPGDILSMPESSKRSICHYLRRSCGCVDIFIISLLFISLDATQPRLYYPAGCFATTIRGRFAAPIEVVKILLKNHKETLNSRQSRFAQQKTEMNRSADGSFYLIL